VTKLAIEGAVPSLTHAALHRLQQEGYIRGVVTTNIDNLVRH
jgi:NAD-dependent SIR2 family protein deacetylase